MRIKMMTEKIVAGLLTKRKLTLAAAESCTGGLISSTLTDIAGSSAYFLLGVIAYSNAAKISILGVRKKTVREHGAVSKETAIEMAKGAKRLASSRIGLGVTGVAGPGGGTPTKPVGTVFAAIAIDRHVYFKKFAFRGGRLSVKAQAKKAILRLLITCLAG